MIRNDDRRAPAIDESALTSVRVVAEQLDLMACIATHADRLDPMDGEAFGKTRPAQLHVTASSMAITFRHLAETLFRALDATEAAE